MIKKTFEELRLSGNFPSPSGVGMQILRLTQREDCSAEEIGQTIMADSVLTGRILKLANAASSGSIEPITTMGKATMRLGLSTVRNVALGLSLLSENRSGTCAAFSHEVYWSKSLARAVAAQRLSNQTEVGVPAEAYILGLLSEVGKLALASVYPDEYSNVIVESATKDAGELARIETERFAINHFEVCSFMLEEWGLPSSFQEAVRAYEVEAERRSERLDNMVDLLHYADALAGVCLGDEHTPAEQWRAWQSEVEGLRAALDMEPEAFHAFCKGVVSEWNEWGGTLDIATERGVTFDDLEERAIAAESSGAGLTVAPTTAKATSAADVGDVGPTRGIRILVVDDDAMSLTLMQRMLEKVGFEVLKAQDGHTALDIALKHNPQMVIADWQMPKLSGTDLCRSLRKIKSGRSMYFLLLTGRDDEDRVVEAFEAGVDDYVVKPFNPKLLLARIKGGQRVINLSETVMRDKETMRQQVAELGRLTRKLRAAALTDDLTGLPNRRYARRRLEQEWSRAARNETNISFLMIDIDHFKSVNDTYGHDMGDVVLAQTARVMKAQTRDHEDLCRMGGEEFGIVCTNSDENGAKIAAERIRKAVEETVCEHRGVSLQVTISVGVAERTPDMETPDDLMKAADEGVYAAKENGRNQTWTASALRRRKSA